MKKIKELLDMGIHMHKNRKINIREIGGKESSSTL